MSEQATEPGQEPEWKLERDGEYLKLVHTYQYPARDVRVTFREHWRRHDGDEDNKTAHVYQADLIAGDQLGDGVYHWLSSIGGTRTPEKFFEWEVSWTQENADQPQRIARSVGAASENDL